MNYKGEACAACGKVFTAEDDVVVCPDCGSPHHRECYKLNGRCANIAFHEEKKKWKRSGGNEAEKNIEGAAKICPVCKFPNGKDEENCQHCGAALDGTETAAQEENTGEVTGAAPSEFEILSPYLGFNPEEDMGGATLKEVSQFVGTNTLYYIPIFKRMKDFGSKISFNISCLIFPYFYFANRKMWGWAMISAIISVFLNLPSYVLWLSKHLGSGKDTEAILSMIYDHQSSLEMLDSYFGIAGWVVSILFCLFGNWLYYKYTMRSLKRLKAHAPGEKLPAEEIMSVGGVKPVNIIFMTLIMGAVLLAALYGCLTVMNAGDILKLL